MLKIDKGASSLTIQLVRLAEAGLSPEEICSALKDSDGVDLDPGAVVMAIESATNQKSISIDELIESKRETAIRVLEQVMLNEEESGMARVKAATIFIERKGCLPLVEADEISEMFKRSKELKLKNSAKLVILPEPGVKSSEDGIAKVA